MSYVFSNANRFYTALEASYGRVPDVAAQNRIPAVKLQIRQQVETAQRRDKTGSRTFAGLPAGLRRQTTFDLKTYMTSWPQAAAAPAYGPLFQAGLGGTPLVSSGGTTAAGSTQTMVAFGGPHGLAVGQAVSYGGEIRFVSAIVNSTTVQLNAPLSAAPAAGNPLGPTVTYTAAATLPSASIFDYWSPDTAVQRVLCGAAVNKLSIKVNGDYHEFGFSGPAQTVIDSSSFSGGIGELQSFPAEPEIGAFDYSIIPGHLGQAWLGNAPDRFFTLTSAVVELDNGIDLRSREFGSSLARATVPGPRSVSAAIDLFAMDDDTSRNLYQAAVQQSPISVMFQLGEQAGQLLGVYLQSVVPDVPEFDDGETRLQWRFREARAQGTSDDEIAVAFG